MDLEITDQEAEQLESPKTLKEWQKLLSVYPKNSIKLMCKMHGGGTGWLPGHLLIDVYGDTAIVQPPKHGHTEKVKLKDIKVWKKGMVNASHHMRSPPRVHGNAAKDAADIDSRVVIYCGETKHFLGGKQGKYSFFAPLSQAANYKDTGSAYNTIWSYFKKHPRGESTLRPTLEYMTYAIARARFRDPDEVRPDKADTQPLEPPAATVAAAPAPEPTPAPVAIVPPPAASPAPATAACADCFNAYVKAATDEAEAEAYFLELRGVRIRAETRVKLDQERRRLGLV